MLGELAVSDTQAVGVAVALGGVIFTLFRLLIAAKNEQIRSYRSMATEAVDDLEEALNRRLAEAGRPAFSPLADVVPEHQSPTTARQHAAAEQQTLRARLTALKLALGLPPRDSG